MTRKIKNGKSDPERFAAYFGKGVKFTFPKGFKPMPGSPMDKQKKPRKRKSKMS